MRIDLLKLMMLLLTFNAFSKNKLTKSVFIANNLVFIVLIAFQVKNKSFKKRKYLLLLIIYLFVFLYINIKYSCECFKKVTKSEKILDVSNVSNVYSKDEEGINHIALTKPMETEKEEKPTDNVYNMSRKTSLTSSNVSNVSNVPDVYSKDEEGINHVALEELLSYDDQEYFYFLLAEKNIKIQKLNRKEKEKQLSISKELDRDIEELEILILIFDGYTSDITKNHEEKLAIVKDLIIMQKNVLEIALKIAKITKSIESILQEINIIFNKANPKNAIEKIEELKRVQTHLIKQRKYIIRIYDENKKKYKNEYRNKVIMQKQQDILEEYKKKQISHRYKMPSFIYDLEWIKIMNNNAFSHTSKDYVAFQDFTRFYNVKREYVEKFISILVEKTTVKV